SYSLFTLRLPPPLVSPLFPYTTLFRSGEAGAFFAGALSIFRRGYLDDGLLRLPAEPGRRQNREPRSGARDVTGFCRARRYCRRRDRKSTRLNSSHVSISYAVFCLKKKK